MNASLGGASKYSEGVAMRGVALDIEPIVGALAPAGHGNVRQYARSDFSRLPGGLVCGLMLADEHGRFRPDAPFNPADLASVIVQAVHLDAPEHEVQPVNVPDRRRAAPT